MRAIIYARYSTDRQADSSIADQFRVCREYAQRHGWQVIAEHCDEGISGAALGNRPGVKAALSQLESGGVLLVIDLSRLSRSSDISSILSRLSHRLVRVIGVQDGYDSTSRTARMQAGMSGIMSEEYRAQIADRTRSALVMRAHAGDPTGGKAYGYRDGEAAVVLEIFERFASGESMKQIACDLNQRDIPAPGASWKREKRARHGRWLVSCLHAMLHNERYAGRLVYNRSYWLKDPEKGTRKRIERPQSEWIVKQIPALVDRETWDACQARFSFRAPPGGVRKYLLSGILTCALCGSKMTIIGGKQHRYYCGTFHNGGAHACSNGLSVPRLNAEAYVLEPVMSILLDPDSIAEAMRQMRAEAKREMTETEDPQILELRRLVSQGLLKPEIAAPAIEEARKRSTAKSPIALPSERMWRNAVANMRDILESDEIGAAREVLQSLLGEIPMHPKGDHYLAEIRAKQIMVGTGTGIWFGSGGKVFHQIPCRISS
jgi:site-specific DNA recombinase